MQTKPVIRFSRQRALWWAVLAILTPLAARADYLSTVLADGPKAYYRFNDSLLRTNINFNSGSLGAAGNATNINARGFPGGLAGNGNRSQFFNYNSRALINYNAALNPPNTQPFTMEAWFYPASDQINGGQCPVNNRYAYSGVNRQGWVIFQRAQDLSYTNRSGFEGVGWNFRMYRGAGSNAGLDVTSQAPFQIGQWIHVAVVYDPVDPVTNASLIIYINGVAANTNIWTGGNSGTDPGYVPNSNDHDPSEAVRGPAMLSLGAYNNTAPGPDNPYFGAVDEFAFYSKKLTPEQILAHYQNGTNANRTTAYDTLIKSENPVAYLRLDELDAGPDTAINLGDLHSSGDAAYTSPVKHPGTSALAGRADDGSFSGHWRDSGGSRVDVPWIAQNNPDASVPFTFEGWFRPTNDRQDPGPAPVNNRLAGTIPNRTGWVIYQRAPNATYAGVSGYSGVGWNFRMYSGTGTGGQNVTSSTDYNIGEWQYLVVTWEPQTDIGPAGNGGVAFEGILTAYVNGVPVATNEAAHYSANTDPTEDGRTPADLAIGSYNAASGFGEEFEGDIDEVAIYTNYVLTAEQIMAHYSVGTNAHPATNYETLVLTAANDGTGTQRLMPVTYFRFNEPALYPAANSGTLGFLADGDLVLTQNNAVGPATGGFAASNQAVPLDPAAKSWVGLNNPSELNISGQITLEAWIKPAATQGDVATIIAHGPPTPTFYDPSLIETNGNLLGSNQVFLRISDAGATYGVGITDGTSNTRASVAVPAGDLGGANWIHLVGTYEGAHWKLYRNGQEVASTTDPTGALTVDGGEWAIGASGNGWADYFAGAVDEIAIYDKALTASQIAAHYAAATSAGVSISISRSGNSIILTWPSGTLLEADTVTGTYTPVPNATSPWTVTLTGSMKFYRLRL